MTDQEAGRMLMVTYLTGKYLTSPVLSPKPGTPVPQYLGQAVDHAIAMAKAIEERVPVAFSEEGKKEEPVEPVTS